MAHIQLEELLVVLYCAILKTKNNSLTAVSLTLSRPQFALHFSSETK